MHLTVDDVGRLISAATSVAFALAAAVRAFRRELAAADGPAAALRADVRALEKRVAVLEGLTMPADTDSLGTQSPGESP